MKKKHLIAVLVAFLLPILSISWADPVTKEIYYQKRTTLSYPATRTFRFSLWLTETGGTDPIWSEQKPVTMTNAYVKTYLGDTTLFDTVPVYFSQQYWVQVDRWKASSSTWVPVGSRDPLGVVPYALYSESSGGGGGGGVTSVTAGAGLTGGGSGDITLSVGANTGITVNPNSIAVDTNVIQARVTGTCPAGQHMNEVNTNGTVNCTADANSGGTVTNVATGAGLTGGPIMTTGTVSIAEGGVTSGMIAAGNVTSLHIQDGTITGADINTATTITADFAHATPKISYYSIDGSNFLPADDTITYGYAGQWEHYLKSGTGPLRAPVRVPHGSRITGWSCTVLDNHATYDVRVHIAYRALASGYIMVFNGYHLSSGSSSSPQVINVDSSQSVDNENYSFFLSFDTTGSCGLDCRIYGCSVKYEVTSVE